MENEKKVVLVLEDEKPLLEAIRIKLEKSGFDVVTARSVDQSKEYVNELPHVDAIWLDHYLLGRENGLDFVVWCKGEGNKKCNMIPIFVVSNTATPDKVSTYLQLGAKEFFVKLNHRLDEIISSIEKVLAEEK